MNKKTQKSVLLDHLKNKGPISSIEAIKTYNIVRPTNRIQELKEDGIDIHTEIVYKTRKDGSVTHYAVYSLG